MMSVKKKRKFLMVFSLILIFALMDCASVEKRFKKGQELESKGRLEEAAQRYIKVLSKDSTMVEARQRLEDVGSQLIDMYIEQAYAYQSSEAYENAVSSLNRIDSLRRRSGQVGVMLSVPDGYEDFRQEMIDAAVVSLFFQGEDAEQAGNWAEALRKYERLRVYPLSSEQAQRADQSRARVHIRWAEQDLARAYFRAAFGRAQSALEILGTDSDIGSNALEIQKMALEAGTRSVAVLPLWSSQIVEDEAPQGVSRDLYDVLLYEYLPQPVLFVAPVDPGAIHRELRRLRIRSGEITRQTAAIVGQNLVADFVVIGWMESYLHDEGVVEEKVNRARLRRDRSTYVDYLERKCTVELTAEIIYQIIDPASSRVVDEETVRAEVSEQFKRCTFDGDYTTLDLTRSERMFFNKEEWLRDEEELEEKLFDALAARIADRLYKRILRWIK
jgi:tetratricopeptide (TPR) repeat protein